MSRVRSTVLLAGVLVLAVGLGATTSLRAQESADRFTIDTQELSISNLIGEIEVSAHDGSSFEVLVRFGGKDVAANTPTVVRDTETQGEHLMIKFPESTRFVYPRLGKGSSTRFSPDGGGEGWFAQVMSGLFGKNIKVSGSGSGLEVWADVEVRVPAGSTLVVRNGVGNMRAQDVEASLEMQVKSGRVGASGIDGDLAVETGSGQIEVSQVDGDLRLSTGSGSINGTEIRGGAVSIATGSGGVRLERVDSPSLSIATGSGRIEANAVRTDRATVATGSGSVHLDLARMGRGSFEIGTGSGRVVLTVPPDASMDVHAETGSGGVDLEIDRDEMQISKNQRDEVRFTVGGGDARVRIGTGSGGIRIAQSSR